MTFKMLFILLLVSLSACSVKHDSNDFLNKDYQLGSAVRTTIKAQIVNSNGIKADISKNPKTLDGITASQVLNGFRNSYNTPTVDSNSGVNLKGLSGFSATQ